MKAQESGLKIHQEINIEAAGPPRRPRRILMVSSLPLAEPWNGGDKILARTIVMADTASSYVVRTGKRDNWPADRVVAVRAGAPGIVPSVRESIGNLAFMARYSKDVDLIHVVASLSRPTRLLGRLLQAWLQTTGKPVVHTIPSLGDRPLSQHHFFADATVVLSEHTRARLADHGIGNVYRIFPPLDLARLQPVADGREASRRLGFGDRMLLYPGHFGEASGIQELLTALSRLPEDLADAQLVLACRAQRGQDWWEEARKLQDTARTLGVEDKVRILGPTVNIEELISACAVSVLVPRKLASKMDLPMAVLESLALGKPVIVGDSQPICEAALGGGLTVPFGDVDALAGAITSLLRDRELRAELAARGRAALVARAHPATAAARYQTIYERVLGRRALGRLQAAAVGEEVEN